MRIFSLIIILLIGCKTPSDPIGVKIIDEWHYETVDACRGIDISDGVLVAAASSNGYFRFNINEADTLDLISHIPDINTANLICERAMEKGVFSICTGRGTLKLGPPLTIPKTALKEGLDIYEQCFKEFFLKKHKEGDVKKTIQLLKLNQILNSQKKISVLLYRVLVYVLLW